MIAAWATCLPHTELRNMWANLSLNDLSVTSTSKQSHCWAGWKLLNRLEMCFADNTEKRRSKRYSRRRQWHPLQYSCMENPMDGGAWWAAVHGVAKSRTRLSDFTFTFHFPALEKEMATHSSVLAWRLPGTEEPGGLPSMRSHRVRHDWSDLAAAAATRDTVRGMIPKRLPLGETSEFL